MRRLAGILLLCAAAGLLTGWSASDSEKEHGKLQKYFEEIRKDLSQGNPQGAAGEIQETQNFLESHLQISLQGRSRKSLQNALREIRQLSRRAAAGDVVLNKRLEGSFARINTFFLIHLATLERANS
jgi:hypothetical protein